MFLSTFRRTLLFSFLTVPFILFSPRIFANGERCTDLFKPYGEPVADRLARVYYWRLEAQALKVLEQFRSTRAATEQSLLYQLEVRQNLRTVDLQSELRSSRTLAQTILRKIDADSLRPPAMLLATHQALRDGKTLGEALRQTLRQDPYFQWLAINGPEDASTTHGLDLIELVLRDREKGVPGEIAVLRLQRTFDPTMSPELLRTVDRILEIYDLESAILSDVLGYLHERVSDAPAIAAWRLSTSYGETRMNLRHLLDEQTREHGHFLSRSEYEKLQWKVQAEPVKEIERELQSNLSDLRQRFHLRESFPLAHLTSIVTAAYAGLSYENALTATFASSDIRKTIAILRRNAEIGDAMRSPQAARAYLHELHTAPTDDLDGARLTKTIF